MDRQVDGSNQAERILCFDSKSGASIWTHTYEAPYRNIGYTAGPRASVTIENGLAYAVGAMGNFHCLDAVSGEVRWSRDLNQEFEIEMPAWGIAGSPLIYQETVIQQVGGAEQACIVAFDKTSGREVWRALDEVAGYSSPIIIQQAGRDVLVCWTGESLSGLNPEDGQVYWAHEMKPTKMAIGIGTPSIEENLIFISSFYDGSMMVRVNSDALESELVWRAIGKDEQSTGSKSVRLGNEVVEDGQVYGMHAMIGTCLIEDGYIYGADSYGQFRCLDAMTGRRVWEDQSAVPFNRWATIHMVRHQDEVWMFNELGELLITRVSPEGLQIIDRCQVIEPTKVQLPRRDGVCWTHPAYAEKSIFVRNDNRLVRASLAQ
jgi:outer membrane protein assembly factor BamB